MSELGTTIAVVGLACRFPQADGPDAFWRVLRDGVDAITSAPESRWPAAELPDYRYGGFLDDVAGFDADFFGIDSAKAIAMDPQQRLLLELTWHAFEDAKILPDTVGNSKIGVFMGAIGSDYATITDRLGDAGRTADGYPGTHRSMISGRISHTFGFTGPSLTVDSGQSSSLVAVHLAAQSLLRGEIDAAVVGGVNLNLLASTTAAIAEFGALSANGRSRIFSSGPGGYVRGEGGAVIVLKRQADADAAGDPIRGLVLGSAVTNDGGGDSVTTPTVAGQRDAIERAIKAAGVSVDELAYIELHGTGTRVGDPIEAGALAAAIGLRRTGEPLLVGSVKPNIGHLEGAAGIAGLVKTLLAIEHAQLPPTVGNSEPRKDIPLNDYGLTVNVSLRPWPVAERRIAGVSSVGMGGTNCHVVLCSAASSRTAPSGVTADLPWLLSAKSADGLRAQAAALAGRPVADDPALALASTRTTFSHRAALLGAQPTRALTALAVGQPDVDIVTGVAQPGGTAFSFPGQGSQWTGMATAMLAESPVFAESLNDCALALDPHLEFNLFDVLAGDVPAGLADRVEYVQPALWAVMVSLAAVWQDAGIRPDLVLGHSQGEIAAATAIGALTLADGARVVALRSRAIAKIAGSGGMLSVGTDPERVATLLTSHGISAELAAVNGPRSVVVSGAMDALHRIKLILDEDVRSHLVQVDYASHSAAVDPLRDEILRALAPIQPRQVETTFVSAVTGQPLAGTELTAEYWFRSLRAPVRFDRAVQSALATGIGLVIECSPHPVLAQAVEQSAERAGREITVVGSLRRDLGSLSQLRRSFAKAWASGAELNWAIPTVPHRFLPALPGYAFQRRQYWLSAPTAAATPAATPLSNGVGSAPLARRTSAELLELVLVVTAGTIGHGASSSIDPAVNFTDLGVESVGALEIRNRLRATLGGTLPAGIVFDHPTPLALAAHLASRQPSAAVLESVNEQRPVGNTPGHDIAIVGIGCRFPGGVDTPERLWELLSTGSDLTADFPKDRGWDLDRLARPGGSTTGRGGFLDDIAGFDSGFFGISPREATAMDPAQRLMLTIAWEALERAGIDPISLRDSATGVFVGAMAPDYGPRLHEDPGTGGGHLLTGSALSVISGRIAYTLGLQAPAITIDTACSSSLVAIHLATQSLRSGESELALAGGVTVMTTPGMFLEFSRQGGLSPDGRCKAFGAGADGTGWSEGAGVLVLQRLDDAISQGRPVLAVLRGTAVNQDGRSNGLSAPNGPAQVAVIRRALADAGLRPQDVAAVEAHGTGTTLGDPIEAQALLDAYGPGRDAAHPLLLGSVKSNIGHTQAAAGVAGVIKMVGALNRRALPPTLHADPPSLHVDWSGALRLSAEAVELSAGAVGVSAFGISGTNAHVILTAASDSPAAGITHVPADHAAATGDLRGDRPAENLPTAGQSEKGARRTGSPQPLIWQITARTQDALRAQANRLAIYAADAADLAEAARVLAARSTFDERACVVASDREELIAALQAIAAGRQHPAAAVGIATTVRPVFVFPGQGSQWASMAAQLLEDSEVFWEAMCRCDGAFAPHLDWSILDVIRQEPGAPTLDGSDIVQPALFAVMTSLGVLWRSIGVEPSAVLGHSQGELSAAYAAGALPLADVAKAVVDRSKALKKLDGSGGLLAVGVTAETAAEWIKPWTGRLWVAIHNSPTATVVGGDHAALDEFERARAGSAQLRRVDIDYAAHTPHVLRIQDELTAAFACLTPGPVSVSVYSGATGGRVETASLDGGHFHQGLRNPVLFTEAVAKLVADRGTAGPAMFLEVSPHPVLTTHIEDTLGQAGAAFGTLRRGHGGLRQFATAAATAFVRGAPVEFSRLLGAPASSIAVPTYAFQNRRLWLDQVPARRPDAAHPLLDAMVPLVDTDELVAIGRLSLAEHPWLADHVVDGLTLLPGTVFAELAAAAATAVGCPVIGELELLRPLPIPTAGEVQIQIRIGNQTDEARREVSISASGDDGGWSLHAHGWCAAASATAAADAGILVDDEADGTVDLTALYAILADRGYDYGPRFRGLIAARRTADGAQLQVRIPDELTDRSRWDAVHPALLDAALHLAVLDGTSSERLLLPTAWRGLWNRRSAGSGELTITVTGRIDDGQTHRLGLTVRDATGAVLLTVDELELRNVPRGSLHRPTIRPTGLQRITWVPAASASAAPHGTGQVWGVVHHDRSWVAGLRDAGITATDYPDLPTLADLTSGSVPAVIVLPLPALPAPTATAHRQRVGLLLEQLQTFMDDERFVDSRLLVAAGPADRDAAVWGLLRSAQTEHPGRFAVADLGEDAADGDPTIGGNGNGGQVSGWAALASALAADQDQFRITQQGLQVPRLQPWEPDPAAAELPPLSGTALITGGTSGLGALVAERLVNSTGIRSLVLLSRRGADTPGAEALLDRLNAAGAEVTVVCADVTDRSAIAAAIDAIDPGLPLELVVHAAGIRADASVHRMTTSRLRSVYEPKANGAWNLHELTADRPGVRLVLFSSIAAILGTAGQSGYAAANGSLQVLTAERRAKGRSAVAIAWGLWDTETGLTDDLTDQDLARLAKTGITPLAVADALTMFDQAVRSDVGDLVIAAAVLTPTEGQVPLLLGTDASARGQRPTATSGAGTPVADRWGDALAFMPQQAALRTATTELRRLVAEVLGLAGPSEVSGARAFSDMGFDSLTVVELRNRIATGTGLRLPATLAFDHPTLADLAKHLVTSLVPATALSSISSAPEVAEIDAGPAGLRQIDLSSASDSELFAVLDGT